MSRSVRSRIALRATPRPVIVSITINGRDTIREPVDIATANAVIRLVGRRLHGPETKLTRHARARLRRGTVMRSIDDRRRHA